MVYSVTSSCYLFVDSNPLPLHPCVLEVTCCAGGVSGRIPRRASVGEMYIPQCHDT